MASNELPQEVEKALGHLNFQLVIANCTIKALQQENAALRRENAALRDSARPAAPELSAAQQMLSER